MDEQKSKYLEIDEYENRKINQATTETEEQPEYSFEKV